MKKLIYGVCMMVGVFALTQVSAVVASTSFPIYTDKKAKTNHFAPSGWMGDVKSLKVSEGWPRQPRSGSTCIRIKYNPSVQNEEGWAGMYWQEPANNWGQKRGFDLTGVKKLTFWIRGDKGGEVINDLFVGGIQGQYPDTASVSIGPFDLTTRWEKFEINLEEQDLSNVVGGFGWATNSDENPNGITFYLDDIRFE